jgi:hypothetical protein
LCAQNFFFLLTSHILSSLTFVKSQAASFGKWEANEREGDGETIEPIFKAILMSSTFRKTARKQRMNGVGKEQAKKQIYAIGQENSFVFHYNLLASTSFYNIYYNSCRFFFIVVGYVCERER